RKSKDKKRKRSRSTTPAPKSRRAHRSTSADSASSSDTSRSRSRSAAAKTHTTALTGRSPSPASGRRGEGDAPSSEPGTTNTQRPSSPEPATKQPSSPYEDKDRDKKELLIYWVATNSLIEILEVFSSSWCFVPFVLTNLQLDLAPLRNGAAQAQNHLLPLRSLLSDMAAPHNPLQQAP
ncbi:Serine/arginine repetitive matrix protein 2, partial [Plecturocebus cupreus]